MAVRTIDQYNVIPSELKNLHQWGRWVKGSRDKMPANLDGSAMKWSNQDNWLSFEEVVRYPQIGYFHTLESGIIGVDFDGCVDEDGTIHPLVLGWIKGTYAEFSPSGKGIKAYFKGAIPNGKAVINNNVPWGDPTEHTGIEIYAQKRFFTVTGNVVPGCPSEIAEAPDTINDILVHFAEAPKNREKASPEQVIATSTWDLNSWVYRHLDVVERLDDGYVVTCPWSHEHTTPGDTARIWEGPPHTFYCFHAHCSGRSWKDVRLQYEPDAYDRRDQWIQQIAGQQLSDDSSQLLDLNQFDPDDAGNGEAMYQLFGRRFIYNESVGWMYYTGTHWQADEGHARLVRAAIEALRQRRHAAVEATRENIVKATACNTQRINGAITCFKAHVVKSIECFDAEEHLLNCKNGVVNLKTGELLPHSDEQYFTYCVPIEYKVSNATEWIDYLHGVVGGGAEMIDYLQLALGYSLTGSTREECLFYVYGPSRSGKGTVAEIILRLLPRPLSTMVDFNSFTAKREGDVSNFDLAELKPSRVVFASESQRNQSLNPAKIKQLTGGDLVRASFKHKNFFTYRPQFKVWMLSNWPVNGDPEDDALWGRVRVIPFPNSYLGKEDKGKKERLKSDEVLTSILYWAVQGAIKWYALGSRGLQTPTYVADVTKSQRDAQDFVQQWLSECCVEDSEAWTPNEVVMASYNQWCEINNVTAKKAKALAQSLQAKGFQTGIVKRLGSRTQKGILGFKIPTTLWQTDENVTDQGPVTDVTANSIKSKNQDRMSEFSISPVTSVTEDQSVTFSQEPEEKSHQEEALDYDAACQLIVELEESGAALEWLSDGRRILHAPKNTQWQREDWRKRIKALDRELKEMYTCGGNHG
jgi:putative DNA primase/helicase